MGSFFIPLSCKFLNVNRYLVTTAIFAITLAYTFSELARRAGKNLPPFTQVTNLLAIGEERWEFAASPILFALGISLSLTLYPPETGFAAITILTLGDGTARIVGKKLGKTILPYNKSKKLEGTIASIFVSTLAASLFVTFPQAIATSIVCMIAESLPLPIDDNIVIPLLAGLVLIAIF